MQKEILENNLQVEKDSFNRGNMEILGIKKSNISPGIFIATTNGTIFIPDNFITWKSLETDYAHANFYLVGNGLDCRVYSATIWAPKEKLPLLMKAAGYTAP